MHADEGDKTGKQKIVFDFTYIKNNERYSIAEAAELMTISRQTLTKYLKAAILFNERTPSGYEFDPERNDFRPVFVEEKATYLGSSFRFATKQAMIAKFIDRFKRHTTVKNGKIFMASEAFFMKYGITKAEALKLMPHPSTVPEVPVAVYDVAWLAFTTGYRDERYTTTYQDVFEWMMVSQNDEQTAKYVATKATAWAAYEYYRGANSDPWEAVNQEDATEYERFLGAMNATDMQEYDEVDYLTVSELTEFAEAFIERLFTGKVVMVLD